MTFEGSPMKIVVWIITEDANTIPSEWNFEMFRCGKEVVEILSIDLTWTGHEYKKSKIYKLLELLTSSSSKFENTGFRTVSVAGCQS